MSGLRPGGSLHRLLYGEDDGTVTLKRGTVSYSYEDDRFRVRDNKGNEVFWDEMGSAVENWLVREGWVNG